MALHLGTDAITRQGAGLTHVQQRELQLLGPLQQGVGQGVPGLGLQACGQLDQHGFAGPWIHYPHRGAADRQGSGLVKKEGAQPGGRLDHIAAAEEHP